MTYRASFPSLHVALSSIALIYAVRFRRKIPFGRIIQVIYLILVVSLWIATVYLRHHWVVDIFAGWALAAASALGAVWVQKRWGNAH
jgi:membrane-associated phospholipid phosphatase